MTTKLIPVGQRISPTTWKNNTALFPFLRLVNWKKERNFLFYYIIRLEYGPLVVFLLNFSSEYNFAETCSKVKLRGRLNAGLSRNEMSPVSEWANLLHFPETQMPHIMWCFSLSTKILLPHQQKQVYARLVLFGKKLFLRNRQYAINIHIPLSFYFVLERLHYEKTRLLVALVFQDPSFLMETENKNTEFLWNLKM